MNVHVKPKMYESIMGARGFVKRNAAKRPFWSESWARGPTAEPAMLRKKTILHP